MRIRKLVLRSYKGFRSYTCHFHNGALLLGPNNAGKSTIISAIRMIDAAVGVASRSRPTSAFRDGDRTILGYDISRLPDRGFNLENIRHEFDDVETRLALTYTSGATCHMVWPAEGDGRGFFWLENKGSYVVTAASAKQLTTGIGWVPTLSPLENQEKVLSREHLLKNVDTPLSSRHFRNNLWMMRSESPEDFESMRAFILENTPEIRSLALDCRRGDDHDFLDLFYVESGGRTEKEINWAGDGLQIWLQILFHIFRNNGLSIIGLDEPDVFLHPDLQRRLVRVLEGAGAQVLLASHAAEVASESDPARLVWVDRSRTSSKRVADVADLESLTNSLGTSFNLSVARALRSRLALFVEGEDMKILSIIAERLGLSKIVSEDGIAIVPIGGFSHWTGVEAFSWLKNAFLGRSVEMSVILDRDYRSDLQAREIGARIEKGGVNCHIWSRKELESYLLDPEIISVATGLNAQSCREIFMRVTEDLRYEAFGQFTKSLQSDASRSIDSATTTAIAAKEFDTIWQTVAGRLRWSPAKRIISLWNSFAQAERSKPISARKLAQVTAEEVLDPEIVEVLRGVEAKLSDR